MSSVTTEKPAQVEGQRRIDTDRIVENVSEVREHAEDLARRGKARAIEFEHEFEDYVKDHPVKSVSVAVGVGVLAGFAAGLLVGRR